MSRYSRRWGASAAGLVVVAMLGADVSLAGSGDDCPPNPQPGKCYEKVLTPARYESYAEQVIDRPSRTQTQVVPAVYRYEARQELLQEGRTELITLPATYRTVTETIVVRPESLRIETIPAVYETVTESVMVREAYTEWRRGVLLEQRPTAPGSVRVTSTGEVLCLVEVPAEYRRVTRQVLRTPARQVQVRDPAETRTVSRQVIDRESHVERREIPAQYRSVSIRVLVTPARVETYDSPAAYRTVTSRRLISPASFEWRMIVCDPGSTPTGRGE